MIEKIEKCLSDSEIEMKQIKRQSKEEAEGEIIKVIAHYNKREIRKNELLRKITLVDSVEEVLEL